MGYSDIKELFRDAKNFATGANDLQLKEVLLNLQDAVYELQEENRNLRDELIDIKNTNILSSELEYRGNGYYHGNKGPYCTTCWDAEKKLILLTIEGVGWSKHKKGKCGNCKNSVWTDIPDPNYH